MRPLIAENSELTVLRSLAAYAYGNWQVEWPDTVPEDQRPSAGEGRKFGYVADLGRNPGRMGRRFVRADVSIKARDVDEKGQTVPFSGSTDVEHTLDIAARKTDGDVFLERDITRAGLNGNVPYVDFDVDDIVPVLVWGRTLNLPVTSIEAVTEAGATIDWRIHVGGQLLFDDAAQDHANLEIERAIAQERRERLKDVGKAHAAASHAQSTADRAQVSADGAQSTADSALSKAELVLSPMQTPVGDDPLALYAAFTRWAQARGIPGDAPVMQLAHVTKLVDEQQEEISRQQGDQLDKFGEVATRVDELTADLSEVSNFGRARIVWPGDDWSGSQGTWTAKGTWVGRVMGVYMEETNKYVKSGDGYVPVQEPRYVLESVPKPDGSRTYPFMVGVYEVEPGRALSRTLRGGGLTPPQNQWTATGVEFTPEKRINNMSARISVTWGAANRGSPYRVRLVAGGRVLEQTYSSRLGPLFPWGNGRAEQSFSTGPWTIQPGEVLRVEVLADAGGSSQREVESSELFVSWTE
ncbi:hypothetical protein [Corynebacterium tapiri]|uniref:Uncharacterized protein n=1 Tax=Corynebacterium tapiri TaxID=1448266 RepID=A0A5C4U4Q2_9CORY|nr:hypothetical protein [Corynebacterium tapiri]TNL98768.1 hypothetical protein FHE74_03885 [Corynebacterium tapiri]